MPRRFQLTSEEVSMILGVFSGTSPASTQRRLEKLEKERSAVSDVIRQGIADRLAGIEELKGEMAAFTAQLARLR